MADNSSINEHDEASTLVSTAALLVNAIEHYGLDYRDIMRDAGLDPDKSYNPNSRLPVAKLQRVWKLAVEKTGDDCFGLTVASFIQPAALHGLGFAWMASNSLKEGLLRFIRYQNMISTVLHLQLEETGKSYRLCFENKPTPITIEAVAGDSFMACVFRLCNIMIGPELIPLRVATTRKKPACAEKFHRFYGIKVEFEATENIIELDKDCFESLMPTANPELARINDQVVVEYLKKFDKQNLIAQARAQIIEQLPSGLPSQTVIARALNLSHRSFQRHLQSKGTSFKQLLDEVRQQLAVQYLTASHRSIIEISYLLGFSDPSNFARAFKRWTSVSPIQYRRGIVITP